MKKIIALLGVFTLLMTSAVSVFASSVTSTGIVNVGDGKDKNGNPIKIEREELEDDDKDALDDLEDDSDILDKFEIVVEGNPEFPITVTLEIPGVTEDSDVEILYFVNGEWKKADVVINADGTVTVTFTEAFESCPVVVKVDGREVATSPKTGEMNVMLAAGCIAVIAFAGVAVFGRKRMA